MDPNEYHRISKQIDRLVLGEIMPYLIFEIIITTITIIAAVIIIKNYLDKEKEKRKKEQEETIDMFIKRKEETNSKEKWF